MGSNAMKRLAALALGLSLLAGPALAVSPTTQFPTTGWGGYAPSAIQCGEALGVNFNSATTDTAIPITVPTANYAVSSASISNASHTLTTATAGVFTATGGGGTALAADQAITVTGAAVGSVNSAQNLTITNALLTTLSQGTLYFRVGTAEGAAATADVRINCRPLYQ